MTRTHRCPGGCGTEIPVQHLACPADWFRLPSVLRIEVTAAFRERRRNPYRHWSALAETSRWYRVNPRD